MSASVRNPNAEPRPRVRIMRQGVRCDPTAILRTATLASAVWGPQGRVSTKSVADGVDRAYWPVLRRRHLRAGAGVAMTLGILGVGAWLASSAGSATVAGVWIASTMLLVGVNTFWIMRMWRGDADPEPLPTGPERM